jgi:hypothetical protein
VDGVWCIEILSCPGQRLTRPRDQHHARTVFAHELPRQYKAKPAGAPGNEHHLALKRVRLPLGERETDHRTRYRAGTCAYRCQDPHCL